MPAGTASSFARKSLSVNAIYVKTDSDRMNSIIAEPMSMMFSPVPGLLPPEGAILKVDELSYTEPLNLNFTVTV